MPRTRAGDFQESRAAAAAAAGPSASKDGLRLVVGADRIALAGRIARIERHAHASCAVVVGLDGDLGFVAGRTHRSRAALLAPGFTHSVDVGVGDRAEVGAPPPTNRMAVFLLPPGVVAPRGSAGVADLAHAKEWVHLAEAVLDGEVTEDAFAEVDRLLARSRVQLRGIDERLGAVLGELHGSLDDNVPIPELAATAKLSASRLMTLAHDELGTSLRRYRRWLRMFRVARAYGAGASLTTAALDAGFSSSAHLSAAAREHFGVSPSQILSPAARGSIVAI